MKGELMIAQEGMFAPLCSCEETEQNTPRTEERTAPKAGMDGEAQQPPIVEGTIVASILLANEDGSSPNGWQAPGSSSQSTRRWRQSFRAAWVVWTLILILLLVADKAPGLLGPLITLFPGLGPSATVTILPILSSVSAKLTIPAIIGPLDRASHNQPSVQVRIVSVTSPALTQTVPATGKGHTSAHQAKGGLTFYNAATYEQTVAAGTLLVGADGIRVMTDAPALLPAGNPPLFGIVTVPAHAVEVGPQGNIAPLDLNGLCCLAGVAVKNVTAFAGGQAAREYPLVRQEDIDRSAEQFTALLLPQAQTALQAEVQASEQLMAPPQCQPTVHTNHTAGDKAVSVTITVTVGCRGEVYDQDAVEQRATDLLNERVGRTLGPNYALLGRVMTDVTPVTMSQVRPGVHFFLLVKAMGRWVYQFSAARLHQFAALVAGKDLLQAQALLLQQSGVRSISLTLVGSERMRLPPDSHQIRIIVLIPGQ